MVDGDGSIKVRLFFALSSFAMFSFCTVRLVLIHVSCIIHGQTTMSRYPKNNIIELTYTHNPYTFAQDQRSHTYTQSSSSHIHTHTHHVDWGDAAVNDKTGNKEEAECSESFACMVLRCCCMEAGMNACAWCGDDDFCVTRLCCIRMELDEKSYLFQCFCCKITKHTNETQVGRLNGLFECVGWPDCGQIRCFCCVAKYDKCLFCGDDDLCRVRCCCVHAEIDNRVERCQIFCIKCPMTKA